MTTSGDPTPQTDEQQDDEANTESGSTANTNADIALGRERPDRDDDEQRDSEVGGESG